MRRSTWIKVAVCGVVIGTGMTAATTPAAAEGDQPYRASYSLHSDRPNQARIIRPARQHPEVAVSRTLAAQPVHPWMAEVRLNDITTYVDHAQPLHRDGRGLDDNHSLRRAQQFHQRFNGLTSRDLAELRNASRAATDRPIPANRAKVITPDRQEQRQRVVRIHVIPKPDHETRPQQPLPATEPRRDRDVKPDQVAQSE